MNDELSFPRLRRIRRSSEYQKNWREGARYHTAHFIAVISPGRDHTRLGLTVSRKVGNAVCRNRLKRWIREFFRHHHKRFGPAVDVAIVAKRQAGRLDHQQLDQELTTLFARLETGHHD